MYLEVIFLDIGDPIQLLALLSDLSSEETCAGRIQAFEGMQGPSTCGRCRVTASVTIVYMRSL